MQTFIILILGSLFFVPHIFAAVVINELFPKSADSKTTWIELYNTGSETVSLDRWKLEGMSSGTSYILNAAAVISPRGFLTLYQPQTGIIMSIEGDTVSLYDNNNALADSQSYPGILGYNTAIGRSADGEPGWVICSPAPDYVATPGKPNKCPPPPTITPTATPAPTNTPTQKAAPPDSPVTTFVPDTPTVSIDPSSKFAFPDVLGEKASLTPVPTPTPTDFRQTDTFKTIWIIALLSGVGIGIIIMTIGLSKTLKKNGH